jgi:hypothetical protein
LRDKWATKARKWRRFSNTWRITSNSRSSTLSNTLSVGEDLKDERERPHGVQGSPSTQDPHHSFSMLSTMLKHGGGIAALHYEHRKGQ